MKTCIRKYIANYREYYSKPLNCEDGSKMILFDVSKQISIILKTHLTDILEYQSYLKTCDNGDVLYNCSCCKSHVDDTVLNIHLLLSIDGANFYSKKNMSHWPIQATVLDLPINMRSRISNCILFAIVQSCGKPFFNSLLLVIFQDFLNNSLHIEIDGCFYEVILHLHGATFDLPAQASTINVKQYNGEFGCLFCHHSGDYVPSGKGHARIYLPQNSVLLTNEMYLEYATLADVSKTTVYGIKGKCFLSNFFNIPKDVLIDGMHLLYENVTQKFLSAFRDGKNRSAPFFLGRKSVSKQLQTILSSIGKPSDMSLLPVLSDLTMWKAHHFKHFLLYYTIPSFLFCLPSSYFMFMAVLVYSAHLSNISSARKNVKFLRKCVNYIKVPVPI